MTRYLRICLVSLVATAAAFSFQTTVEIELSSLVSSLVVENFHEPESDYRWSRARSAIRLPYVGSARRGTVEIDISSFRPRHMAPPRLVISQSGSSGNLVRLGPRGRSTSRFEIETPEGVWGPEPSIVLRSEVFSPGEWDRRALGVRVHSLRFVPEQSFQLAPPPLRGWLFLSLACLAIFGLGIRWGLKPPSAEAVAVGGILAGSGVMTAFRLAGWILLPTFTVVCATVLVFELLAPRTLRESLTGLRRSLAHLARAGREVAAPASLALALVAALGTLAIHRMVERMELRVGPGKETWTVSRFAGPDRVDGVVFRVAQPGARVELPDHGSGSWSIELEAALAGPSETVVLASTEQGSVSVNLNESWSTHRLQADASPGWTSGPTIEFPAASAEREIRLRRVRFTRRQSWPSFRLWLSVVALCLAATLLANVCGLRKISRIGVSAVVTTLVLAALAVEPILAPDLIKMMLGALVASVLLIATVRGFSEDAEQTIWSAACLAVVGFGMLGWFLATLYPLYVGGHFEFHSNIASEIWQGRFWHYYLPRPGSMLSRQPQWGDVIVPHSCLYHTIVSPFASLPAFWFASVEKLFLAGLLAGTALVAARTARHLSDVSESRADVFTASFAVVFPITYQLLGLGHLMTLFGAFAGALALGLLAERVERLGERRTWWWAVAAFTFCFVSYTASLLFGLCVLCALFVVSIVKGRDPRPTALLVAVASGLSLILYYGNWVWPFVSESIPALAGGETGGAKDAFEWWHRVADVPRKMSYSFGSVWIPIFGTLGVILTRRSRGKEVLVAWVAVLPVFACIDLLFNFLLKHHYFTFPAFAIGLGLLAERLWSVGVLGKLSVGLGLAVVALLGLQQAVAVATGAVGVF